MWSLLGGMGRKPNEREIEAFRRGNEQLLAEQALIAPVWGQMRAKFNAIGCELTSIRIEGGKVFCTVTTRHMTSPEGR